MNRSIKANLISIAIFAGTLFTVAAFFVFVIAQGA